MYKPLENPNERIKNYNGSFSNPKITLQDEYGQKFHIVTDDHCYVLKSEHKDGLCHSVHHWFPEAITALVDLWYYAKDA